MHKLTLSTRILYCKSLYNPPLFAFPLPSPLTCCVPLALCQEKQNNMRRNKKDQVSVFNYTAKRVDMHGISIHRENIQREISSLTSLTVLLATSGQKRCTSLVCSCYVPSRNFNNRGEERNKTEKGSFAEKKDYGVMEEVSAYESVQDHQKSNGGRNSRSSGPSGSSNGPHLETSTLKSNLKKTASTTTIEENQANTDHQKRKVRWPDIAYGRDIAHVLEFEPSISDDGEVEGVRNSCVCTIQ